MKQQNTEVKEFGGRLGGTGQMAGSNNGRELLDKSTDELEKRCKSACGEHPFHKGHSKRA